MNLEKMIRKYAYTLAKVGLNVQKGQTVLVEACVEGHEFTPVFAEECYKLGAGNVVVHYLDMANMKVAAKYRSDQDVRKVEKWEVEMHEPYLEDGACYVRLEGVDVELMKDVSEEQSNAIFAHVDAIRNIMRKASREKHCQWLIAMIPTKKWASYILNEKDSEKALEELWKLLFKLCYIDEENDVVETWKQLNEKRRLMGNKIDALHLKKLHYTASNGTDLTIGLSKDSKFGYEKPNEEQLPFNANIPTEEICTTPDKYQTEGIVYASRPLVLGGKSIENFGFRFKKGKVIEVLADEGKEMLEALIHMDENAAYLGECALVEYHSPISMSHLVYYTTLIDENASCHLALGRGFGKGENFNDSSIHVDFMIGTHDMQIMGIDQDDHEIVVFKDGDFAL